VVGCSIKNAFVRAGTFALCALDRIDPSVRAAIRGLLQPDTRRLYGSWTRVNVAKGRSCSKSMVGVKMAGCLLMDCSTVSWQAEAGPLGF
jgi:hypothetical protein